MMVSKATYILQNVKESFWKFVYCYLLLSMMLLLTQGYGLLVSRIVLHNATRVNLDTLASQCFVYALCIGM